MMMKDLTARRRTGAVIGLAAAASLAGLGLAPVAHAGPPPPTINVTTCTNGGNTTVSWSKMRLQTLSVTWVRTDGVREIHDLTTSLNTKKSSGKISYPTPAVSTETWATYKTDINGDFTDTTHVTCQ